MGPLTNRLKVGQVKNFEYIKPCTDCYLLSHPCGVFLGQPRDEHVGLLGGHLNDAVEARLQATKQPVEVGLLERRWDIN